ncbi:MAG: 1-deoxy-D-xylulose-5-phosphate synthase, partial [Oscillospiraceae bacterium]|nr:1-deoxy-D-xylulose-5-phosphate synthase [Oscillospiraceae bacterium]
MRILDTVNSPKDLEPLNVSQLNTLSEEIRAFLIESVSQTGGHLSSNLGTVDLTLALHKVFHAPQDKLVFDVGHQCYTHKILTERKNLFHTLRQKGGLSGFPSPKESQYDAFNAGHGNTSISAAIGIARAKKLKGEIGTVIAIIGDGAFTGGMVYEGINNIDTLDNLIVILNDNEMSISKNVGALARYFTSLRTSPRYYHAKKNIEGFLNGLSGVGHAVKDVLVHMKTLMRQCIYEKSTFFEELGFQYVGVVDGHNIEEMLALFKNARAQQNRPLFIHIVTKKGKGFKPAEKNPGEFHGVSAFDIHEAIDTFESSETNNPDISPADSFSNIFGQKLAELAVNNKKICAITAAMKYGTGLQFFYKQHKKRFFDVGMAEQHAVTFAAGLAQEGLLPVVAIYSTFLQRSYDQIIH